MKTSRAILQAVSKTISSELIDGESIGFMLFRGSGAAAFREALDTAIREPGALKAWYLSVIDGLVDSLRIETTAISNLWWAEIDSPEDLREVRAALEERESKHPVPIYAHPSRALAR
jgi:choline kinase